MRFAFTAFVLFFPATDMIKNFYGTNYNDQRKNPAITIA
jgi:hypothetical protein